MASKTPPTRLISAIVPVFSETENLDNLRGWLADIDERIFEVILVIDNPHSRISPAVKELRKDASQKNIKVIDVNFGSPGLSRNEGIDASHGEWITFWDCDDIPDLTQIKNMTNAAIDGDYKIALGYFEKKYHDQNKIELNPIEYFSKKNFSSSLALEPGIWRFVFDRSIIGEIRFPNFRMGEDQAFLAQVLTKSDKPYIHSSTVYRYVSGGVDQLTSDKKAILELRRSLSLLGNLRQTGFSKEILIPMFLTQSWSLIRHVDNLEKIKIGFRAVRFQALNFDITLILTLLYLKRAIQRRKVGAQ